MKKTSTWQLEKPLQKFPKLNTNIETEVVIIGGGMVGMLSAYLLSKAGRSVALLESKRLLSGATSMTTAFLTQNIDTDIPDMISMYGAKTTKEVWNSHGKAIDLIEKIIKDERIDCEFRRCSNYAYINQESDMQLLQEEYYAMKKLGFPVDLKKHSSLGFIQYGYIETKNQAKFHPLKFLSGLVPKLQEMGVQIFEQTEAVKVTGKGPVKVQTKDEQEVKAQFAITATYDPLNNPKETFAKKGMYVSYVYEVQIPAEKFRQGIYEDFENPYHYFRIDRGDKFDRMIIGGEDNRQEVEFRPQKNFRALADYLKNIMGDYEYNITKKWRGPILEPSDGLPLIGRFKPGQLIATAFSGNGMTYSGIAAMVFRDEILGKKNKWAEIYDPTRTPSVKQLLKKGRDYVEEFVRGAVKNTIKH